MRQNKFKKNSKKTKTLAEHWKKRSMTFGQPQVEFKFGTGCMPSVMDGTEHVLSIDDKAAMPDEFSW